MLGSLFLSWVALRGAQDRAAVRAIAFASDGKRVAVARQDGSLELWQPGFKSMIRSARGPRGLMCVGFSPREDLIALGGADGRVALWDARELKPRWETTLRTGDANGVAFSRDGRRVGWTTAPVDRAYVYETSTRRLVRTLSVLGNGMSGLAFVNGGSMLVTGGQSLMVWSLDRPAIQGHPNQPMGAEATYPSVIGWTPCLSANRRGDYVLAGGAAADGDGGRPRSVVIVDPKTGRVVRWLAKSGPVVLAVAFSPDARLAAATDEDGHLRIWRSGNEDPTTLDVGTSARALAFHPDGRHLALGLENGEIRWLDAAHPSLRK